jgi:hypothetical protein
MRDLNAHTSGDPRRPILVYTMGKVGTGSLIQGIAESGLTVYKAHTLDPVVLAQRIQRARARGKEPDTDVMALDFVRDVLPGAELVRTITVVRESVGRNMSGFFQSLWRFGVQPPWDAVRPEDLVRLFFSEYNHARPNRWFRQEFRRFVQARPFELGFDAARGHHRFRSGRFDVLLLQSKLDTARASALVSEFLGAPVTVARAHNISAQKDYGDLYRRFKEAIEFPESYLERICRSAVMRAFYTPEQCEHVRRFYRREIAALHPFPRPT